MAVSRTTIELTAVASYRAESDRFKKLADFVEAKARRILAEAAIGGTVSSRVKSLESFERKLQRKQFANRLSPKSDFRVAIPDLAGVRICTYRETDRTRVLGLLERAFAVVPGSVKVMDEERKSDTGPSHWYSATHLQVQVPAEDQSPQLENVTELSCEIQVCSLVGHVWNEVEHDINYKPFIPLSDEGRELLIELGKWREAGDVLIGQILDEAGRVYRDAGDISIRSFIQFRQALRTPTPYSFEVLDLPIWREIHTALVNCGLTKAGDLWAAVDLTIANYPGKLMTELNTHPVELLRALGARAAVRLPLASTTLLSPQNHAHRLIVSLLPAMHDKLSIAASARISAIARAYEAAYGLRSVAVLITQPVGNAT